MNLINLIYHETSYLRIASFQSVVVDADEQWSELKHDILTFHMDQSYNLIILNKK